MFTSSMTGRRFRIDFLSLSGASTARSQSLSVRAPPRAREPNRTTACTGGMVEMIHSAADRISVRVRADTFFPAFQMDTGNVVRGWAVCNDHKHFQAKRQRLGQVWGGNESNWFVGSVRDGEMRLERRFLPERDCEMCSEGPEVDARRRFMRAMAHSGEQSPENCCDRLPTAALRRIGTQGGTGLSAGEVLESISSRRESKAQELGPDLQGKTQDLVCAEGTEKPRRTRNARVRGNKDARFAPTDKQLMLGTSPREL